MLLLPNVGLRNFKVRVWIDLRWHNVLTTLREKWSTGTKAGKDKHTHTGADISVSLLEGKVLAELEMLKIYHGHEETSEKMLVARFKG
jgi:hypothetical protein